MWGLVSSSTVSKRHAPSGGPAASLLRKVLIKQNTPKPLSIGYSVEVHSQDSGIRRCWFRGSIVKRHRDKLKIRYHNILDADESGNLEEWVFASRVAVPDELGFQLYGRTTVRPIPPSKGKVSWALKLGLLWMHDAMMVGGKGLWSCILHLHILGNDAASEIVNEEWIQPLSG